MSGRRRHGRRRRRRGDADRSLPWRPASQVFIHRSLHQRARQVHVHNFNHNFSTVATQQRSIHPVESREHFAHSLRASSNGRFKINVLRLIRICPCGVRTHGGHTTGFVTGESQKLWSRSSVSRCPQCHGNTLRNVLPILSLFQQNSYLFRRLCDANA